MTFAIGIFVAFAAFVVVSSDSFIRYNDVRGSPYSVSYDSRSFLINGKRTLLLSGGVHYGRLSPAQWKPVLMQAYEDGLNVVQTYLFWNLHEPTYNFDTNHTYHFDDRANISGFLQTAADVGLFVNLRVGPYICGEWDNGGLPNWLFNAQGIKFRDNNTLWMSYMSEWLVYVSKNAIEPHLAKNGGPIIVSQIENEYVGLTDSNIAYAQWCGDFANNVLNYGNPWTMCREMNYNNTLNSFDGR